MFVVWRRKPVKGQGGAPFLVPDHDWADKFTCWMPLRCDHRGDGRVAHTALVMRSVRVDGKPRQERLERFPTIRSCCIEDRFNRAAWWHRVGVIMDNWQVYMNASPQYVDYSRDAPAILRALRAVVPRPCKAGPEAFHAFRLTKEAEHDARQERERRERWEEQERRRQEREERERRERAEQAWRQQEEYRRAAADFAAAFGFDLDCFDVLGLRPTCTLAELKARFYTLAKRDHPDAGGDAAAFCKIRAAYEAALDHLARRGVFA